jgi:hypothetical protein
LYFFPNDFPKQLEMSKNRENIEMKIKFMFLKRYETKIDEIFTDKGLTYKSYTHSMQIRDNELRYRRGRLMASLSSEM